MGRGQWIGPSLEGRTFVVVICTKVPAEPHRCCDPAHASEMKRLTARKTTLAWTVLQTEDPEPAHGTTCRRTARHQQARHPDEEPCLCIEQHVPGTLMLPLRYVPIALPRANAIVAHRFLLTRTQALGAAKRPGEALADAERLSAERRRSARSTSPPMGRPWVAKAPPRGSLAG